MRIIRKYKEYDEDYASAKVYYVVYGDCRKTLQRELDEQLRETGCGDLPSLGIWSNEIFWHEAGEKYTRDAEILPDLDEDGNTVVTQVEGYNI